MAVLVHELPDDAPRRGWKVVPALRPLPLEGEIGCDWRANVALPLDEDATALARQTVSGR